MQCLALQLLTDPRRQNQTHPLQSWELHPCSKSARRSLRQRCFLGAAHAGPSATSIGALTLKRKSPEVHAFPVWQHCPRRVERMSLRALGFDCLSAATR